MGYLAKLRNVLNKSWFIPLCFFIIYLLVGLVVYKDFGISWDESTQMNLGIKTYEYVFEAQPGLFSLSNRWHGSFFQFLLVLLQNNSDIRLTYLSRHLITFLAFFAGTVLFYFLGSRLFKNQMFALLGTLFLILSPRIFADSFYNCKDIPFLVAYIFSLFTLLKMLDSPNYWRIFLHALSTAILIAIRMPGIIIPVCTAFGLALEWFSRRIKIKKGIAIFSAYIILAAIVCYIIWPVLWTDPFHEFIYAFTRMSHFPLDLKMLFMGNTISSLNLPWYYIPVWIIITTPLLYLIAFLPGLLVILSHQKKWFQNQFSVELRDEVLFVTAFFAPIFAIIILKSVLYDAWRQMFFVYPSFIIISIKGIQWGWMKINRLVTKKRALGIASIILLLGLGPVLFWMVENHPYHNVYFNRLAGKDMHTIQENYMLDFWGLSYREGLEFLASYDQSETINVFMETPPGARNIPMLMEEDAARMAVAESIEEADYFIGNYYRHKSYPYNNEIYNIQVGNTKILSIFAIQQEESVP